MADPTSIDFDPVAVNQPSAFRTVTLTNRGSTPSELLSVTLSGMGAGSISVAGNTCDVPIPPGSSCAVSSVQYLPIDTAGEASVLTIADGSSSVGIPLVGTGVIAVDAEHQVIAMRALCSSGR